ncbi:hypothetical protein Q5692_11345 [Microcoleus sp. C2C3]|uniref:hypothetical protein n=1 Tax=unclassified Microcoleus TaxID=2642155 RepID=UPI002FCF624B
MQAATVGKNLEVMTVILNKESRNPAAKSLPRRGLNRKAKTKGSQIIGKVVTRNPTQIAKRQQT